MRRPSDIFCRYGGEEFICILGITDISRALKLCKKIHFLISSFNIAHKKLNNCLTVNVGLACVRPEVSKNKDHLVVLTDTYLYQAKSGGKNTTRFHNYQTVQ